MTEDGPTGTGRTIGEGDRDIKRRKEEGERDGTEEWADNGGRRRNRGKRDGDGDSVHSLDTTNEGMPCSSDIEILCVDHNKPASNSGERF